MLDDKQKQIKINFYTNIAALVANVLVGVYYTPYLVRSLGLAAYGVLPLALIINQYIGVATHTFTHSYTRFYSVALQKNDLCESAKVLSTSFLVVILICIGVAPIAIGIIRYADKLFQIPYEYISSARYLFCFTILSFFCSMLSSLLNVMLYANNRLDLLNLLKIIRSSFKLLFVVAFFEVMRIDISLVGLANFSTECIILLISYCLFVRHKPSEIKLSTKLFDKKILYSILGMSFWVLIQLCGDTLLYRTDNLLLNHYWGSVASGALGAISEIGNYVSIIVSVISSLFGPLILIAYARNEHEEVKTLFVEQSTIVGCLSAIFTGIIAGCSYTILEVWLGEGMGIYQFWLLIKMVTLPFYAAGGIMAFVYRSWNEMKIPAIGTIILGVLDVVSLVIVCEFIMPNCVMAVLILSSLFSIAQCFVLNAISVTHIYTDCWLKIIPIAVKIILSFTLCLTVAMLSSNLLTINNLFSLGVMLVSLFISMFVIVFYVILNKNERIKILSLIK